jgi:hypothetical protein
MQSDCFKSSGSWLSIDAAVPGRRGGLLKEPDFGVRED